MLMPGKMMMMMTTTTTTTSTTRSSNRKSSGYLRTRRSWCMASSVRVAVVTVLITGLEMISGMPGSVSAFLPSSTSKNTRGQSSPSSSTLQLMHPSHSSFVVSPSSASFSSSSSLHAIKKPVLPKKRTSPSSAAAAASKKSTTSKKGVTATTRTTKNLSKKSGDVPPTEKNNALQLFVLYMTPWRNPNSIFVYMFLTLYLLGEYSESQKVAATAAAAGGDAL